MIIWFTGISGVGKSTLGRVFFKEFKFKHKNTIFIDGDKFRELFGNDLKYSLVDRNKNAKRLINFVRFLDMQKINIILAANLTSKKNREWCKKNLKNYYEISINANLKFIVKRDKKNIYNLKNKKNVVGFGIPFYKTNTPFLNIDNNYSKKILFKNINKIYKNINKKNIY
jgi:adenylylsulfate kinase-like enzyme